MVGTLSTRSARRQSGAAGALALSAALTTGCVFDLKALQTQTDDNTGGMGPGDAQTGPDAVVPGPDATSTPAEAGVVDPRDAEAMTPGDADSPGSDADVDPDPCPGQQLCHDRCIALGAPCTVLCVPDCALPNAVAQCTPAGECVVVECSSGFVDCDGAPSNGCEANFNFSNVVDPNASADEAPPLPVARLSLAGGSGAWHQAENWAAIPMTTVAQPCIDCDRVDDVTLSQPTLLKNRGPSSPSDLSAGFSLAWAGSDLYLRVLVRDDQRIDVGDAGATDPRGADNIEFLFDGDPTALKADDRHLFVDFTGLTYDKSFGMSVSDRTEFFAESSGSCTTLTGRLTGQFLTLGEGLPLALEAGAVHHFNIAVNDYDLASLGTDGGASRERQTHLFYRNTGNGYWYGDRVLPTFVLE